ncbi:hypothetical protein PsYK624_172690 [Phanerochaete sordida]|uniref:Uncharacterized protein n=1 Tax=Phanerochaete sordida TaxID=48140 RepID=A0A9P3GVB9_9APHY|nr:hypothetical protein PsYK624_172690 [Phanerochaete sordida]
MSRICQCGIYCKELTPLSALAYLAHQKEVLARGGSVLPSYEPATPALRAYFARKSIENGATGSQPWTLPLGTGQQRTGKQRKAAKGTETPPPKREHLCSPAGDDPGGPADNDVAHQQDPGVVLDMDRVQRLEVEQDEVRYSGCKK